MEKDKMRELVNTLKDYAKAYVNGTPIVSDKEYDALYDDLAALEKQEGYAYPDSPTQTVGAAAEGPRKKVRHEYAALSLAKTKEVREIVKAMEKGGTNAPGFVYRGYGADVMWKMDGVTVQLTYEDGNLVLAATRGNGEIGLDITDNAPLIAGIPAKIGYKGKLTVRGEAVMPYSEFDRINASLAPGEAAYTHPRNLTASTVSLSTDQKMRGRHVEFFAFDLVHVEGGVIEPLDVENYPHDSDITGKIQHPEEGEFLDSHEERLIWMKELGIQTVPYQNTCTANLAYVMGNWTRAADTYDYPVDGLVVALDIRKYALGQPGTGHNPNILVGYALKWQDETAETVLRDIEWSPSRTGLLNPVAVFDPVELEGATLERATLHNVSYIWQKNLKAGDRITIYRANKVIPAVDENLDAESHDKETLAELTCPCCGRKAVLKKSDVSDTVIAMCENPDCAAKNLGRFVHFCERDCMNILGLSEKKLEFLIDHGYIRELHDIYEMKERRKGTGLESLDGTRILEEEPGWDKRSVDNLLAAIEVSRKADFIGFIHALGIPNFGKGQAKVMFEYYHYNEEDEGMGYTVNFFNQLRSGEDFRFIDGFGDKIQNSLMKWAEKNLVTGSDVLQVWDQLNFPAYDAKAPGADSLPLKGTTFVITGKVTHYKNRTELQAFIESLGGTAAGSVSGNTDYLINNDSESASSKNQKAKKLGVKIITEEEFEKLPGVTEHRK